MLCSSRDGACQWTVGEPSCLGMRALRVLTGSLPCIVVGAYMGACKGDSALILVFTSVINCVYCEIVRSLFLARFSVLCDCFYNDC